MTEKKPWNVRQHNHHINMNVLIIHVLFLDLITWKYKGFLCEITDVSFSDHLFFSFLWLVLCICIELRICTYILSGFKSNFTYVNAVYIDQKSTSWEDLQNPHNYPTLNPPTATCRFLELSFCDTCFSNTNYVQQILY